MTAHQYFKDTALADLQNRTQPRQPVHTLETVGDIQQKVLSMHQLDSIERLGGVLSEIARLQFVANEIIALSHLSFKSLLLAELGQLKHGMDGKLFDHSTSCSRLQQGAVPSRSPQQNGRAAA